MANKNHTYERLEDQGATFERVDSESLATALGAERDSKVAPRGGSPFTMAALRSKLLSEIVSSGGRPGRKGEAISRKKIPLTETEWQLLDRITAMMKTQGVNATPGQVAGVLLHDSINQVLRVERRTFVERRRSAAPEAKQAKDFSDSELEETLENILAVAASAEVHLEQLRPVALELLRRMRHGKGAEDLPAATEHKAGVGAAPRPQRKCQ